MDEYKPNSHKYNEKLKNSNVRDKNIKKVVPGIAKIKKKNAISKLTDIFIPEDVDDIKSYIISDFVIPAVKNTLHDILDVFLGGSSSANNRRSRSSTMTYRSYEKDYDRREYQTSKSKRGYDYGEIILGSRAEAEAVLTNMDEIIAVYGTVSVSDLYEMVGIDGEWTDARYGWKDIRNAKVTRVNGEYVLKLPRALPLN